MDDFYGDDKPEEDVFGDDDYILDAPLEINKIRLGKKHANMIREIISDHFDFSFPRYCERVGIKTSNFYATLSGYRPCSLEFLNKLLSGVGFQVIHSTSLTIRRVSTGETAEDANSMPLDDEWLSDVEEDMGR